MILGVFTLVLENHFQGEPTLGPGLRVGRGCVIYSSGRMVPVQIQHCKGKRLIPRETND